MDPVSLLVPAIASVALGGALLVPIRDGRQGRKATVLGRTPLTADFSIVADPVDASAVPGDQKPIVERRGKKRRRIVDAAASVDSATVATQSAGNDASENANAMTDDTSRAIVSASSLIAAREPKSATDPGSDSDEPMDERAREILRAIRGEKLETSTPSVMKGKKENPFASLRGAIERMRSQARARTGVPETVEADNAPVMERSFAEELAALLPAIKREDDRLEVTNVSFTLTPPLARAAKMPAAPNVSFAPALEDPVTGVPAPIAPTIAPVASAAHAVHATDTREPVDVVSDVTPRAAQIDRAVPLTRLPLRFVAKEIRWPATATPPLSFATDTDRYAFLRSCASVVQRDDDALLARAFREETPVGRALVLAALRRSNASRAALATFVSALTTGSDDERAIAIDALSDAGAREEIARGLGDRVDAIAAKAALAFVGTTARDDYRVALAPYVDDARIDAILSMLAGIVE